MIRDDLGTRMKSYYEETSKTKLVRRMPVAIRIDGKAFHTFTKKMKKPFDDILIKTMQSTMKYLCKHIQNCVFGYTQSDEITLILVDYDRLETSAWYDYEVQKLCSISASMATMAFNKAFKSNIEEYAKSRVNTITKEEIAYHNHLVEAYEKSAMFDSRCFNIPKEEVCNLVYWRQLDAHRNSISMIGQSIWSPKELHKVSTKGIIEMLEKSGIIVEQQYEHYKLYGTSCIRLDGKWKLDYNMPILRDKDRSYVDDLIYIGD